MTFALDTKMQISQRSVVGTSGRDTGLPSHSCRWPRWPVPPWRTGRNSKAQPLTSNCGTTPTSCTASTKASKHTARAPATLTVVDADGTALSDAQIEAVQSTHDFLFGCNLFFLDGYETEAENHAYEARFAQLFNFGSAPFYWSDLEPEQGKPRFAKNSPRIYRRPPPDLAVEFAQKHGITLKGHPLMWNHFYPSWLPKDKDQVAKAISTHMAEIAERYADKIKIWDVVNETLNAPRPEIILPDD
jgi:hypothetical protein